MLALAGSLWVLAIGTRQILAVPILFMVVLVAILILRAHLDFRNKIRNLILLGLPLVLGTVSLGWYNWARFNSITETGLYYQLAGPDIQTHYKELFSSSYVIQNLYNYLFNSLEFLSKFPFVFMLKGRETPFIPHFSVPEFYNAQPVVGIVFIFPFVIFSTISIVEIYNNLFNRKDMQESIEHDNYQQITWISVNMGGAFLISFCLLMAFFWAGVRYVGDFLSALIVFSSLGFWQGYRYFQCKPRVKRLYSIMGATLAITSILISMLMTISTNSRIINLIVRMFAFIR